MQVPETGRLFIMNPALQRVQAVPEKTLQLENVEGMALQAPETK